MKARILALLAWLGPALIPACAAETVLWRLGEPDRSGREFKAPVNAGSNRDVIVRVGSGKELREWPRFHPGSGNGMYGGRPYRFAFWQMSRLLTTDTMG